MTSNLDDFRVLSPYPSDVGRPIDKAAIDKIIDSASPNTLLVFIDEMGDETLPPKQPYFGLAACAIFKRDYADLTRNWFRLVGRTDFHARKHAKGGVRRRNVAQWLNVAPTLNVGELIAKSQFRRDELVLDELVFGFHLDLFELFSLLKQEREIDSFLTVVEHSERLSNKIGYAISAWGGDLANDRSHNKTLFVRKDAKLAGLQIADTIAYGIVQTLRMGGSFLPSRTSEIFRAAFTPAARRARFNMMATIPNPPMFDIVQAIRSADKAGRSTGSKP